MGVFDAIGQSLDWLGNRWTEDWHDVRKSFTESWKSVPAMYQNVQKGLFGMGSAAWKDDGDFWGSAKLWMDSSLGLGGGLLGGTFGSVFQIPILHEASWLLDKAYRYGVARPYATQFLVVSNSVRDAYEQGRNPANSLMADLTDFQKYRKAFNDSEYVTPGQAIVYSATLGVRGAGDYDAAMKWAAETDPKTPEGQAKFNGPDAGFWLKYTSGTLDAAGNVIADPGHGSSALFKLGKLRLVDKVATSNYVLAGKVHAEVGTSVYNKVRRVAEESKTPEQFGQITMPQSRFRGQTQTLLWSAAQMDKALLKRTGEKGTLFDDTYLSIRAFDVNAFQRLAEKAPQIAADFADMFANKTITDYDFQRGQLASEVPGANALRKTTVDAFVDSFAGGEGIWGSALGKGVGEKIPKVRIASQMRAGYHSFVLKSRPIIVGRPLANLMPSQGWTPQIDANDGTGIGLRQFKANLERAGLPGAPNKKGQPTSLLSPEEINLAVSQYGAATSDAIRHTVAMRIENRVVQRIFDKWGLDPRDLGSVLEELNRWRSGSRKIWGYERRYISEEAATRADKSTRVFEDENSITPQQAADAAKWAVDSEGVIDGHVAFTDVDGRVNMVPLNRSEPILRSQFAEAISMLDYRALNGALRWHNLTHPKLRTMPEPESTLSGVYGSGKKKPPVDESDVETNPLPAGVKPGEWYETEGGYGMAPKKSHPKGWNAARLIVKEGKEVREPGAPGDFAPGREFVSTTELKAREEARIQAERDQLRSEIDRENSWKIGLSKLAKLRGFYDVSIGALDAVSTMWKATALMRPAQAPRNLADDVLRMYVEFGKLHMLTAASDIVPNMWRNWVPSKAEGRKGRAVLTYEAIRDKFVKQQATGKRAEIAGDVDGSVVDNVDLTDQDRAVKYLTPASAFADGAISLQSYVNMLRAQFGQPLGLGPKFGIPRPGERKKTEQSFFTPSRSAQQVADETGKPVRAAPKERPVPDKPPRPSEQPGMSERTFTNWSGPPHLIEATLLRQLDNGQITEQQFRLGISMAALTMANKTKFQKADWGMARVKELFQRHLNRRSTAEYLDDPYAPGTLVVNPFDGTQPKDLTKRLREHFDISSEEVLSTRDVPKKKTGAIQSIALGDVAEQMKLWVGRNADELMKPGVLMAMRVRPDGNVAIGYATIKPEHAPNVTVKTGASQRLKNFEFDEIKDIAHTGFDVKLKNGQKISFGGVFDGPYGQLLQRRISARTNPSVAYGSLLSDIDTEMSLERQGSWGQPLPYYHKDYAKSWERAVNAQIASDPVAREFLKRKADGKYQSDADVIDKVETSAWGHKWVRAMGFRGVAYVDQIRQIKAMVDTYLPHPDEDLKVEKVDAANKMRDAVLNKQGTRKMLDDVLQRELQPEVHGVSVENVMGVGRAWQAMRNGVRQIQKVIADMPVDKIARFPFMAMAYKNHGTTLAKIANEYFPDGAVPAQVVNLIKESAAEKAYHDTRYRLYDTAQRNDVANATRLLMPFSAAMMDSYIKYGRNIRENPVLLAQGAYYWDLFERNQMVQDENGNVASEENGHTVWHSVDPTTGKKTLVPAEKVGQHKYVQFQMPSGVAKMLGMDVKDYYGVEGKTVLAVNKSTMNVFLNLPSAGPLVAFPANEFALSHPDFGEDKTIREYVLPFGPSSSRSKVFLPSTVRTAWDAFVAQDGDTAGGHAAAIMQAELIGTALGTRNAPPTFEEVRQRANGMRAMRFMSTMISPASFQMSSPYQPYIDAYRQLIQEDPTTAAEKFMARHGDEFYAVTMSVTRNVAGLSASLESYDKFQKFKKLIAMYPEFGGLIVGADSGGAFAKSVYESQKETPVRPGSTETLRSVMSLQESVENLQKKTIWSKYAQMNNLIQAAMVDRGITSLQSRAAKDLKATKDAFVNKYKMWTDPATGNDTLSPWYLDFSISDRGAVERKFEALRTLIKDPDLQKRDDIRGLAEYLAARDGIKQVMERKKIKSLDGTNAGSLRDRWDAQVHDLVESNGPFLDLWSRWLSNDNKLDIG